MAKLTPKQKRFCDEYLIDLNATQAAIRAGYSKKTADRIGNENLKKLVVREEIQKKMKDREQRTEVTQDWVIRELQKIASVNGTDYAQILGGGYVAFKTTDELSEDKKAAISAIKETKFGLSVETYDKLKALELLGRHLGMFNDKLEIKGNLNNPFEALSTDELKKLIRDG